MPRHVRITCPHCQRGGLRVRPEYLGRRVACKHCDHVFPARAAEDPGTGPSPDGPAPAEPASAAVIAEAGRRATALEGEIERVRAELATRSGKYATTRRKLHEVRVQLGQSEDRGHRLQEQLDGARGQLRSTSQQRDEFASAHAEGGRLLAQLEGLRAERDRLEVDRRAVSRREEGLRTELDEARRRLAEEASLRDAAGGDLARSRDEALARWGAERQAWQASGAELRARVREAERRLVAEQARSEAASRDGRERLDGDRARFDAERRALQGETARLLREAEALGRERAAAIGQAEAARRDVSRLRIEVARLVEEADQAARRADLTGRRADDPGDEARARREECERQGRHREAEPPEDRRRPDAGGGASGSDPARDPVWRPHEDPPAPSHPATIPPARRPDLLLRPIGDEGRHVVKDLRTGEFFELGPVESFLLLGLDGRQPTDALRVAYEGRFAEPLSPEDLEDFLELARGQGFLAPEGEPALTAAAEAEAERVQPPGAGASRPPPDGPVPGPSRGRQSLLYWRKTLFDPDRLFNYLEPRLRFLWTRGFLAVSGALIVAASWLVWVERQALVTQFPHALRWETLALAWVTMVTVTTLHEFAHGLTCKRHGGEVHEVGFLLMYGLPCFFCNVSDAWLFRERWKRLWVTIAGGYCDLVLWAVAVFTWRVTLPDSLPNYVAWVVLSICGIRVLFNFNPLLKLDGYYILSDWLEMPNLRKRAWDSWMGHLRWALWGGPRPGRQPRGRFLLGFGMASWLYTLSFTALVLAGLRGLLSGRGGALGIAWMSVLGFAMVRGQFDGFTAGEFGKMIRSRRTRAVSWAMAVAALAIALSTTRMDERVGGAFTVRPTRRAEVRARIAGFLREIDFDEGDRVSPGASLARLEVPDLESRIAQKRAQVEEAEARLRLLRVGPRPEEVQEQRARVKRGEAWLDLGRRDLTQAHRAFEEELMQLDEEFTRLRLEQDGAAASLARAKKLADRGAESRERLREEETKWRVAQAQLRASEARKRAREAAGTLEAEAELSLREQKLAEARAALALLEVGTRPEEIEAERARLALLQEEARYLEGLVDRVEVTSPVGGLVATPRLKEKVGQYLREGDLICEIEAPDALEYEVVVAEQDEARVRPGQPVVLKARALPYETFRARVDRIAPRGSKAEKDEVQATFVVYCGLADGGAGLRPGMTGHARIACGRKRIGELLLNAMLRVIRTEFWW